MSDIKAAAAAPTKTIMCLVDGSPSGEKALHAAMHWKRDADTLYIVTAVELYVSIPVGVGPAVAFVDPSVLDGANESLKKRATAMIAKYIKETEDKKLPNVIGAVISTTQPKDSVLRYSEDKKVDIMFVGCRGLSAVKRFFLGSFSNYIVNNAKCDVTVVKHHEEESEKDKAGHKEEIITHKS